MKWGDPKLVDRDAIAARLRATRAALHLGQTDMCRAAGIAQNQYSQFESETGDRLLTLVPAVKLCERFGLTLDWLYRGDPSGLPQRLASLIAPVTPIRGSVPRRRSEAAEHAATDFPPPPKRARR